MADFHINPFGPLESVPIGANPVDYIRASAPMPPDAERLIDKAVTDVKTDKLVWVDYMYSKGLTFNLADWLGTMKLEWLKASRGGNPIFSMDPMPREEDWKPDMTLDGLPIYCVTQRFTIPPRLFAAWERYGTPLDTNMVSSSVRSVHEAIEVSSLEGPPVKFNGLTVPGLLDTGSKVAFADATAWTDAGKTGAEINSDIDVLVEEMQANEVDPPYVLLVNRAYGNVLNKDYVTTFANTKTTRQRLLDRDDLSDIITVPRLAANTVVLVSPSTENLDLVVGQQPAVISWVVGPANLSVRQYMVIACVIPRFRETYTGQSGVVIGVPSI